MHPQRHAPKQQNNSMCLDSERVYLFLESCIHIFMSEMHESHRLPAACESMRACTHICACSSCCRKATGVLPPHEDRLAVAGLGQSQRARACVCVCVLT